MKKYVEKMKKHYTKKERTVIIPEYLWKEFDHYEIETAGEHLKGSDIIFYLKETAKNLS